jgi:sugar lactone lactonase YvrE
MDELLFSSKPLTPAGRFTNGIEGPACSPDGTLYAVNYTHEGTIGRVTPEGNCNILLQLPNGSVGNGIRFARDGAMLIADYVRHTIFRLDVGRLTLDVFAHEPAMHQPNDLAIAANGHLFASDPSWADGSGRIWHISLNGQARLLDGQMGTTNGIEVSPDGRTLYVNETVQRTIWAYDLAPDGSVSRKRLLIRFADFGLDGMRCDVAGNLYVTRYGKGTIAVVSPAGVVLREVALSGRTCTNLTFGGPDGRTCAARPAPCSARALRGSDRRRPRSARQHLRGAGSSEQRLRRLPGKPAHRR